MAKGDRKHTWDCAFSPLVEYRDSDGCWQTAGYYPAISRRVGRDCCGSIYTFSRKPMRQAIAHALELMKTHRDVRIKDEEWTQMGILYLIVWSNGRWLVDPEGSY